MYFMYVDESGDCGAYDATKPSHYRASQHYIVSGLIIPAVEWRNYLMSWVDFRRYLKAKYGFPIREELHGAELIRPKYQNAARLLGSRQNRVNLYREALDQLCARMPRAKIINVRLDKHKPNYGYTATPEGIVCHVWERLLERYDLFLKKDCGGALGLIYADNTNEVALRRLLRQLRVYHFSGSHWGGSYSNPLTHIVEDPTMRDSKASYFVQISDLVAHALYRKLYPKGSLRSYNVDKLFDNLNPVLHLPASRKDPYRQGIVHC